MPETGVRVHTSNKIWGVSLVRPRSIIGKWSLFYQSNLAKPCQRHLADQSELGRMGAATAQGKAASVRSEEDRWRA